MRMTCLITLCGTATVTATFTSSLSRQFEVVKSSWLHAPWPPSEDPFPGTSIVPSFQISYPNRSIVAI